MSNVPVSRPQGGAEIEVNSGGVLTIKSGGAINVETGGQVRVNGTQQAAITALTNSTGQAADNTVAAVGAIRDPIGFFNFTGRNNVGAITLTGVAVGDVVTGVLETTAAQPSNSVGTNFEAAITVTNQIQQTSVSDLSARTYVALISRARNDGVNQSLSDLAAKINEINTAIKAAGITA